MSVIIIASLIVVQPIDQGDYEKWIMKEIEKKVSLPKDAAPIKRYNRNYAWADNTKTRVQVRYVREGKGGSHWLDDKFDLPLVLDGGCQNISFEYDISLQKAVNIDCNGGSDGKHRRKFFDVGEEEIIFKIERTIRLPKEAAPIKKYVRYYSWADNGHRVVSIVYFRGKAADYYWDQSIPSIDNKDCIVMNFEYDLVTDKTIGLGCHGRNKE